MDMHIVRNNVFDNTKLFMIFLVVFGHFIEPVISKSEGIKAIFMSIYSFHMPVFIILSGMLSKVDLSENRIVKNITSLIVPFLIFTVLYEILNVITGKGISHYTLTWQPYWILWFLFSMFIWKTTLPIVMQFRFPLLLSVLISLAAGYVSDVGYFLGISRTLYFFPFFIVGYILGPKVLSSEFLKKIPSLVYLLVLALNLSIFWLCRELPHQWLYGSVGYAKVGDADVSALLVRATLYLISFISSIAILMLMPSKETVLTKRGENSLFVYIWHGFFIKIAVYFGLINMLINVSSVFALIVLFVSSIVITGLLSNQFVATQTNSLLLKPFQKLILKK